MILVDPPAGWKYGFPRLFDFKPSHPNLPGEEYEQEYRQWFIDKGYPRSMIEQGMLNHCRYIGDYDELIAMRDRDEEDKLLPDTVIPSDDTDRN